MNRFSLLVTRGKSVDFSTFATLDDLAKHFHRFFVHTKEMDLILSNRLPGSVHVREPHDIVPQLVPFNVEAFDGMSVLKTDDLLRHGRNLWDLESRTWRNSRFYSRFQGWNGEGPVPGTGKRVRYSRHWLRFPQTQRARRDSCRPLDEGEPKVRAKRNFHHLPSSWDDVSRSKPCSWKNQGKRRKSWDR